MTLTSLKPPDAGERQLRSGCGRPRRSRELTLTAIKPTFGSAAGAVINRGKRLHSGRSRLSLGLCQRRL